MVVINAVGIITIEALIIKEILWNKLKLIAVRMWKQ